MNDPNWLLFQFPAKGIGGNGLDRFPKCGDRIPTIIRCDARSVAFDIVPDFFVPDDPPHCRFEAMSECMKPNTLPVDPLRLDPLPQGLARVVSRLAVAVELNIGKQWSVADGRQIGPGLPRRLPSEAESGGGEIRFSPVAHPVDVSPEYGTLTRLGFPRSRGRGLRRSR